MEKVGAFVCTGCEIGDAIDMEKLEEYAKEEGAVHYATHECLCSEEGVALIKQAVEGGEIDGRGVASCCCRHGGRFGFQGGGYRVDETPGGRVGSKRGQSQCAGARWCIQRPE